MTDLQKRGAYNRRSFDSGKHCGAPVDRDPESLRARLLKYRGAIDEFRSIESGRSLTPLEKKRLGQKCSIAHLTEIKLKKLEEDGPDDRPCMQSKGHGTDHPGVGLCNAHCECKGRADGHLSTYGRRVKDVKLGEYIDKLQAANTDILNLEPILLMMIAKFQLFLDEKQDLEPETIRSIALIQDQIRKTVDTINDKKFKAMISLDVYTAINARMGEVVGKYVQDQEVLERIILEWDRIKVDTNTKQARQIAERVSS